VSSEWLQKESKKSGVDPEGSWRAKKLVKGHQNSDLPLRRRGENAIIKKKRLIQVQRKKKKEESI